MKSPSNPNPKRCRTAPCPSCNIWYGGEGEPTNVIWDGDEGEPMYDPEKATEHNPKEDVKEHATDKFTEEKVEREIPDLESGQTTTDGNFNPDK